MSRMEQPHPGTPLLVDSDDVAAPWWARWFEKLTRHVNLVVSGNGSPEGTVVAQLGRLYLDEENGALYVKESDGGEATGWVLK